MKAPRRHTLAAAVSLSLLAAAPLAAAAQEAAPSPGNTDATTTLDSVRVTGSRIKQSAIATSQPVFVINRQALEETGVASVGEVLQQLSASGQALNAKYNSSGNFGYPADGGGIGAGSAQVDLRNLGSRRVLVLVDGIRWVNESSASGVSGSADLNTIPLAIVDRIEVLEDGASAIYGSDAIAGVVNIITRKSYDGAGVHTYFGRYSRGGDTKEGSLTLGGSGDRWSSVFTASYYEQDGIGSGEWEQSASCQPGAGRAACSSGTPQGRFVFFDPTNTTFYNITLNDGTTNPVFVPGNPNGGTFNSFDASDRFNYAPFNYLLTPSKRMGLFTSFNYELSENTSLHIKALYNNRKSENQAAPEPIFVGPGAGTGGLADTISIPANHPFNPFGFALDANNNFVFIGRRPLEVGPRQFRQDVDTTYFNVGLEGMFDMGERTFSWDANAVHTENEATQEFTNGYNVARIALALGDPAVCAAVPGCVPLDLFGGQGRPFTQQMIDYIRTNQRDSSKQTLDLVQANLTGDLFFIGDRAAGFATGVEHRRYRGDFNPDPLRQTGESQDSFAAPVSASYDVSEIYGEVKVPVLESLELNGAIRYSDYSTFGGTTTGKLGFLWRPVEDFVFRGTYSTGFRAPNLGELYGLTQFDAQLVDPCGPTGSPVVNRANGVSAGLEQACVNQGVPDNFEQANTQISTFTGGNPQLEPEESKSWTVGFVYSPAWAENLSWARRLDLEMSYYNHEIEGAIQARDLQALLDACVGAGGTNALLCSPFTRQSNGNLNPPNNFLQNFGVIETDGLDIKANWMSPEWGLGTFTAGLQATFVNDYRAVDEDGIESQRTVGVLVGNGAMPEWQANLQLGWRSGDLQAGYALRYTDAVEEDCTNAIIAAVPGCLNPQQVNKLGSVVYHDINFTWSNAFALDDLKFTLGVNNVFGKEPPVCVTCQLNGMEGSYDLPGAFWYVSADYRF